MAGLDRHLIDVTRAPAPVVDWNDYPESRPGCGSKSVEPDIFARLAAEDEGSPIRARRIEVGESDDIFEFMFEQGQTDGLPVVPPTPERALLRMLGGTTRDPQAVLGEMPPNLAPVTVEEVAINAGELAAGPPEHSGPRARRRSRPRCSPNSTCTGSSRRPTSRGRWSSSTGPYATASA
ncbi:MAG: hypothetical protein U5Q44_04200 [Dehalococcoidia bacterium]|nr:hypothetical protein [Dehalococcoidia bacterium]